MKNKVLLISLAVALAASLAIGAIGCTGEAGPPTKIKIGAVRSLSGGLELIGNFAFAPVLDLWVKEVNTLGGINTVEYGKLPVEVTIQDDNSQQSVMTSLLTSMVTGGKYHYVMPPISTAFLQAAAPICSNGQYVLLGAEGGCTSIMDSLSLPSYTYLFSILNFSNWNQMERLFEILDYCQTQGWADNPMDVYVIYINDLHGEEYTQQFGLEMANYPGQFNIVGNSSVEPNTVDVSSHLITANTTADLFCSFTYPPTSNYATMIQHDQLGIVTQLLVGPGGNFEFLLIPPGVGSPGVGLSATNLTMGFGAWNEYSGASLNTFAGKMIANNWLGYGRMALDWWGAAPYYAGLQIFQQAIERSPTIDNTDVRTELAKANWVTSNFSTILGDAWFVSINATTGAEMPVPYTAPLAGGLLAKEVYAGQVGQWQDRNPGGAPNMIFEVVDLGGNNTATVVWEGP